MAGSAARLQRAVRTHRQAAAIAAAAGAALAAEPPPLRSATTERSIRELAERLRAAAARLAPGWLGAPLDAVPASAPTGGDTALAGGDTAPADGDTAPELVRIGTAYPLDDASFPVVVPLGHLAVDSDTRDPRVAGVLQAVLLRLLASARAGSLLVRAVDPAGTVCPPFAPLHAAGILPPPAIDAAGLRAVLGEAEQRVRAGHAAGDQTLLLVIAGWPADAGAEDLPRLPALASQAGTGTGVHLLLAGWPPPPLPSPGSPPGATVPGDPSGDPGQPLPHATQVRLRNPYALVGHPPGGSFAVAVPPGQSATAGLPAQVFLDQSPPADLIGQVCAGLAASATEAARVTLGDLLPDDPLWTDDAAAGLATVLGRGAGAPTVLRLGEATAHWLVLGGPGAGRTALLLAALHGLATRYRPDQLAVYLLDPAGRGSFTDAVPSGTDPPHLPHARAVATGPDLAEAGAVLRALVAQLDRRPAGAGTLPRLVCLVDDADTLLAGEPEAAGLLQELAERGGPAGVHLVLAGRDRPPEPIASRCRVRIALPGGAAALDPANHAAAALATGTAVVNTAGGLGGPRGATRAHERLVRFPDLRADPTALAGLRHRLWQRWRAEGGTA